MSNKGNIPWNKGKKGVQTAWNKGLHFSDESIKKSSETRKRLFAEGKLTIWNKGLTKESNYIMKKISENRKGIIFSDSHKENLKQSHLGKKTFEGTKKKLRLITNRNMENPELRSRISHKLKGRVPWNKDKFIINQDVITKISNASKKMWEDESYHKNLREKMKKENNPFYGKHHSEESLRIMKLKRRSRVLPKKDTKIELKIQNFLKELNIEFFTHQYMKDIEHGYQCDIFIPSRNMIIECFGTYWHKYPIGRDIDTIRCNELRREGYKVFVFWENEIHAMRLKDFQNKLQEVKK